MRDNKKQRKTQRGANYMNPQTYMGSQRFHAGWLTETFDKLTVEKTMELFSKYKVFNSGIVLFDSKRKEVILGEYNDPYNRIKDELSHFGGGLRLKDKETPLTAAMRELGQESQWLLSLKSNLAQCPGIIAVDTRRSFCYIIFFALCYEEDIEQVKNIFPTEFQKALEKSDKVEVKSIQTISLEEFIKMVRNSGLRTEKGFKIYEIIRNILNQYEIKVGIEKTFNDLVQIQKTYLVT